MYTNLKDVRDIDLITELTNRGYMVVPRQTNVAESMGVRSGSLSSIDDGVFMVSDE